MVYIYIYSLNLGKIPQTRHHRCPHSRPRPVFRGVKSAVDVSQCAVNQCSSEAVTRVSCDHPRRSVRVQMTSWRPWLPRCASARRSLSTSGSCPRCSRCATPHPTSRTSPCATRPTCTSATRLLSTGLWPSSNSSTMSRLMRPGQRGMKEMLLKSLLPNGPGRVCIYPTVITTYTHFLSQHKQCVSLLTFVLYRYVNKPIHKYIMWLLYTYYHDSYILLFNKGVCLFT